MGDVGTRFEAQITRGRFLRGSAVLLGGVLAAPLVTGCADRGASGRGSTSRRRRVAVVGAGAAGIAAAATLDEREHEVVILEARSRVGGRLHSVDLAGAPVDLGASWVHGLDDNPVMPLLEEVGVASSAVADEWPALFGSEEGRLDEAAVAASAAAWERRRDDAASWAEDRDDDVDLATAIDRVGAPLRGAAAWTQRSELHNEYGTDPDQLSAWWYDEGGTLGPRERLVTGGYDRIARHFARGLDVRTNSAVTRIEHGGRQVRVHATGHPVLEVDAVIVTVPVAVLRAGAITFDPPLPGRWRDALERVGMAHLEKVALRFEEDSFLEDLDVLGVIDRDVVEEGIAEFHRLPRAEGATTLLGLVGGEAAIDLVRRGPEAMRDAALDALRRIAGDAVPRPVAWRASRWTSDPLARGSYSYLRPGGSPDVRELLAEPFDGRLVFAGEAMDPTEPATVHGAIRSGRRAANLVSS